jgi:chemotaxis protein histidine kinase CheA
MATINKDFKVKNGLIVEGTTGTINNQNILTEVDGDAYILGLVGGESFITSVSSEFDVSEEKELSLDRTVVDAYYDAAGSADAAQAAAEATASADATAKADAAEAAAIAAAALDATSKADAAQAAAEATASADATAKANAAQAAAEATASADATAKADAALASANSYTDDEVSALDLSLKAYADQAESDAVTSANSYTDGREVAITAAYEAYADQAEVDAKAYADQKVNDLIGGAPELLDTLNEIAAAINDDENFFTTIESQIALKADKTYVDTEISDLNSEAQGFADAAETAANAYTDAGITQEVADRNSAISDAITTEIADRNTAINAAIAQEVIDRDSAITTAVDAIDTDDIEEGENNLYFTNQRAIDAVGGTIGDQIDLLTTDDIEEGINNEYFTDERATDAVAIAIANGDHANIAITYADGALSFQAENGVADSTTSDLAEGANLYFTDARAVSALEAVTPNFVEIDINSVATQIAATSTVETASTVTAHAFAKASYRSAEYLVKVAYGTHTEVSKVLLTLDTSDNIAITEYAIVGTNGSASSISADISGDDVRLRVSTNNNSSEVTVVGTLVA